MRTALRSSLCGLVLALSAVAPALAQSAPAPYPAPSNLDVFRMASADEEIALARSAAPGSIANDADILTLGAHGFETAVKGKNGFVCLVDRGWAKPFEDPEFWNPKVRAPMCMNPVAAKSVLPLFLERAGWAISGVSRDEIAKRTRAELDAKTLPRPAPGTLVYMMSKQGYIADAAEPHWHPHVMFYAPLSDGSDWGANAAGAPVISTSDDGIAMTTYFVLVPKWSDGSPAMSMQH